MSREIVMPALEMAQETGTLIRWLKSEGDFVRKGEPLMEIETDKAAVEIEAPESGTLSNVSAQPGDRIPVGRVIAFLLAPQEQTRPADSPGEISDLSPVRQQKLVAAGPNLQHLSAERRETELSFEQTQPPKLVAASPKARRRAIEQRIDLLGIFGSGPSGAVLAADVESSMGAVVKPSKAEAEYTVVPIEGMRRSIAERMQRSHQLTPVISLTVSIHMGEVQKLLDRLNPSLSAEHSPRLKVTAFLAKAVAVALLKHPRVNSHLIEQEIREYNVVHLGIATALEDGLIVPVIRHVESKELTAIQFEMENLITRARSRSLRSVDIQGSTFTLSNLGMFAIEQFTALLNPPEVGILSVGAIKEIPVGVQGRVVLRPMIQATLNADHRAIDGAVAARFLESLKGMLEDPAVLIA